jgi:hypothetical protein
VGCESCAGGERRTVGGVPVAGPFAAFGVAQIVAAMLFLAGGAP